MAFDYGETKADGQHTNHPSNLEGEIIRPYRDTYVHTICGVSTKMPEHCAITYQKNPKFYTTTFCYGCRTYPPISEFTWKDGTVVGS